MTKAEILDVIGKYGAGSFGSGFVAKVQSMKEGDQLELEEDELIDRILNKAGASDAENKAYFDEKVAPQIEALQGAAGGAQAAGERELDLLGQAGGQARDTYNAVAKDATKSADRFNDLSGDMWDKLQATHGGLNESDQQSLQRYLGETEPLMEQINARGYGADVTADPEGLAAQRKALGLALTDAEQGAADQRDVMNRYRELSSPEVGAQERYIGEMARRQFEGQDRGNREAVMQNLSQRGLNSGTLQIANNLAAQERLGQERTQAELGMQANAVNRGMQGLAGYGEAAGLLRSQDQNATQLYGNQAGQLRTANDAISTFNKEGSQVAQRYQDTTAQNEANRVGNLAGARNTTTQATNQAVGDRAETAQSTGSTMLGQNYDREQDARGAQTDAANVGYDTREGYAGAVGDLGQQGFTNQAGVAGATASGAGVRAGLGGDEEEALKLALGSNATRQAVNTV